MSRHGLRANVETDSRRPRLLSCGGESRALRITGQGDGQTGLGYRPALYGKGLDWRVLGRIEDALDDLLLPYTFSLLHHTDRTDPELAAHIARVGGAFYEREGAMAKG